ncbi:MAG: CarD family transcriptional regulator [Firmicutes bacterium]|nr:CarD family transcriptional regulator [Bacillota bacterium]
MFHVGDRVVYPMHGAGVIEAVEEREILGERKEYYVMRMPIGEMQVLIPVDGVDQIGLREVMAADAWESVAEVLSTEDTEVYTNWNRRYRANAERLKTGDIYEVAAVVRNLMVRDRHRSLSTGERKMLDNAKRILVSEIVLACGVDEACAARWIEEAVLANQSA